MNRVLNIFLLLVLLTIAFNQQVTADDKEMDALLKANSSLEKGDYQIALEEANSALQHATTKPEQNRANGVIGNSLLAMNKFERAEQPLLDAYNSAEKPQDKASYANSLGVLYHGLGNTVQQQRFFKLAQQQVGDNKLLALKIDLNWMRFQPETDGLPKTDKILTNIATVDSPNERSRLLVNLAEIAKSRGEQQVAKLALEKAYADNDKITDVRLSMELLDSLADIYESNGKYEQALALSEQASTMVDQMDLEYLLINLEWRKARLYERQGRNDYALAAFGRAVDNIQAVRMDIPVEYHDGKSSFRETLEPVYLGYAYHLLKKAGNQDGEAKQRTLLLARKTVEQIKQTEMEDFLGGRCLIEGLQRSELETIDTNAAILYPIILPDRLEILMSIGKSIHQYTVSVSQDSIREAAVKLSNALRKGLKKSYRKPSENLYQWIIAPIEKDLENAGIKTLVIVPDGVLRLIPFSALSDGQHYVLEKYAVSVSPGMSLMSGGENIKSRAYLSLLAGLSKPGSVVEKLPSPAISGILEPDSGAGETAERELLGTRAVMSRSISDTKKRELDRSVERMLRQPGAVQKLQKALSLPGVENELDNIKKNLKNNVLLNENFTIENFRQQVTSEQPYEIIHIASHGIFSSDANNSFLMAYDNILKLDDLEALLRGNKGSLELLTFSACETAEGDDRAPMGFAGAALRAKAKSALGSLWPISDEAASQLMTSFYRNLTQGQGKAEALRQAQLELLHTNTMNHPYFWSPFILVGNWL
ncbi:MAG: CHAT domain-containing protein [Methylococcales bacterium]